LIPAPARSSFGREMGDGRQRADFLNFRNDIFQVSTISEYMNLSLKGYKVFKV